MIEVGSYCCSFVESPLPSSKTISSCAAARFRFFGFGIGVMNSARRRVSRILCVGCPCSSSSQCRAGLAYGEFRMGRSKNGLDMVGSMSFGGHILAGDSVSYVEIVRSSRILASPQGQRFRSDRRPAVPLDPPLHLLEGRSAVLRAEGIPDEGIRQGEGWSVFLSPRSFGLC